MFALAVAHAPSASAAKPLLLLCGFLLRACLLPRTTLRRRLLSLLGSYPHLSLLEMHQLISAGRRHWVQQCDTNSPQSSRAISGWTRLMFVAPAPEQHFATPRKNKAAHPRIARASCFTEITYGLLAEAVSRLQMVVAAAAAGVAATEQRRLGRARARRGRSRSRRGRRWSRRGHRGTRRWPRLR